VYSFLDVFPFIVLPWFLFLFFLLGGVFWGGRCLLGKESELRFR